ncbi:MAG TPA: hypothetical protein VG034_12725 [Acidimicrobiia bacterium]|nr:hypothetical protein [Acidimicrobiia bacterium]
MPPKTRYARTTGGVNIAYQVVGDGPLDLVFIPGYVSNVEYYWEMPGTARALEDRRLQLVDALPHAMLLSA